MSFMAKRPGRCANCPNGIHPGQEIEGQKGAYRHVNCAASAPAATVTVQMKGPKHPSEPMSVRQHETIVGMLEDREVTKGEASAIIDVLLTKPRKRRQESQQSPELAAAEDLIRRLAS